jgi:hypothetical protein
MQLEQLHLAPSTINQRLAAVRRLAYEASDAGLLRLLRRRSTGQVIERDRKGNGSWTRFAFPTWWHYDVLRGLDYLRSAGVTPDERMAEAIRVGRVQARRRRAVAARDPISRRDADRDGRGRGPTEPVEHLTRPARAPLVQAR